MNLQALDIDPASFIPANKYAAIDAAVVAACDARDGVKDGVIDDPTKCDFKPAALLCKGAETAACLTEPQIARLKRSTVVRATREAKRFIPDISRAAKPGRQAGDSGSPARRPRQGLSTPSLRKAERT